VPRLAVIGYPVAHSRSPAMQSAALEALGLGDEWSYGAVELEPERFEEVVREMAAGDYLGANVTVPHKETALAVADDASDAARAIGAANTLSFRDGRIEAENTDAGGLLGALPNGARRSGEPALVLGAGGAARAAIWALAHPHEAGVATGALSEPDAEPVPRQVHVWNRTAARAEALAALLGARAVESPSQGDYGLIVNTTAVGLRGEEPFEHLPLAADAFIPDQIVVDMVYGERPSALLAAAEAAGATTVDGLEVLVQQGALSLEIWTGRKPDLDVMRAAAIH
jgi:shikimate dehydrogenase